MTCFTVSLARVPIRVEALHPSTERFCREYLTDEAPAFTVTMAPADIDAERRHAADGDAAEGVSPRTYSDAYLETLALYRKLARALLAYDTAVFHGSVVALDGRAFAFTAPSGTGKTTHTRLWLKNIPGSYVLNGDKPLLRLDGDRVLACGTPWRGKERYGCPAILPLDAVVLLERGAENRIEPLSFHDALPTLLRQTHRPPDSEGLLKTLALIGRLEGRVRLFRLSCTMEDEAARVCLRGLVGEGV